MISAGNESLAHRNTTWRMVKSELLRASSGGLQSLSSDCRGVNDGRGSYKCTDYAGNRSSFSAVAATKTSSAVCSVLSRGGAVETASGGWLLRPRLEVRGRCWISRSGVCDNGACKRGVAERGAVCAENETRRGGAGEGEAIVTRLSTPQHAS